MRLLLAFFFLAATGAPCFVSAQKSPCLLSETYANTIAQELFRVLGGTGNPPKVFFVREDRLAACSLADADHPEIHIDPDSVIKALEEKFGNDCKSTDADDALAFIIGHEVWHIIKHRKAFRFKYWDVENNDFGTRAAELDADLHGLIGAYFIGKTNCLDIYRKIFPTLKVPSSSLKYPSTEERMKMENEVKDKAQKMFLLYESANCLLATNSRTNIQLAASIYAHIGERFHFLKQINYNLGLANLLLALGSSDMGYLLPLEPAANPFGDLITRAGAGGGDPKETEKYLKLADDYFTKAQRQDPDWFEPYLGSTCVALLRQGAHNVYEAGEKWRKQHPGKIGPVQESQLKMLEAIAYLIQQPVKEEAKAKGILANIANNSASTTLGQQARYNLDRYERKTVGPPPREPSCELPMYDGIRNAEQTLKKYESESGWEYLTDPKVTAFQKSLAQTDVVIFERKEGAYPFPTVLQFYRDCPLKCGSSSPPNGRSEYRYLPGKEYGVVTWMPPKGAMECAKVLEIK